MANDGSDDESYYADDSSDDESYYAQDLLDFDPSLVIPFDDKDLLLELLEFGYILTDNADFAAEKLQNMKKGKKKKKVRRVGKGKKSKEPTPRGVNGDPNDLLKLKPILHLMVIQYGIRGDIQTINKLSNFGHALVKHCEFAHKEMVKEEQAEEDVDEEEKEEDAAPIPPNIAIPPPPPQPQQQQQRKRRSNNNVSSSKKSSKKSKQSTPTKASKPKSKVQRETSVREKNWNDKYERLKQYKADNGHCRVPQNYGPDLTLGQWVNNQRQAYKRGEMAPDRVTKLNKICFDWALYQKE